MKHCYKEEYGFKITVNNGQAEYYRNGHEVGNTYICEYGGPDGFCTNGFCSKSMAKLFPLMEAVRSSGDLSNLLVRATKRSGKAKRFPLSLIIKARKL